MVKQHRMFRFSAMALVALMAVSCASVKGSIGFRQGRRAYEKKDYVLAMEKFMDSLVKNPEREDTLALFPRAFNEGTAYYLNTIDVGLGSGDPDKLSKAVTASEFLQKMNDIIKYAGRSEVETSNYYELIDQVRAEAAEAHYEAGKLALEGGTPKSGRAALRYFTLAESYGAHSAVHLRKKAEELATVKVLLMTKPNDYFDPSVFSDSMAYFMNQLYKSDKYVSFESSSLSSSMSVQDAADNSRAEIGVLFDPFNDFSYDRHEDMSTLMDTPVFDVKNIYYSFTKHASAKWTISYNWQGQGPRRDVYGSSGKFYKTDSFVIKIIQSDGMERDIRLDDTGSHNLRYVFSKTSDEVLINEALNLGTRDYNYISTPSVIENENSQSQWHDYFMSKYNSFSDFKYDYSGKLCFYGVELVRVGDTYYYINGRNSIEAKYAANRSSAIMNGLAYTAKALALKEQDNWGGAWSLFEKDLKRDIDSLLNE